MTNKLQQAARQALEALEVYEIKLNSRLCNEAIAALREALAEQAEQEPVAWALTSENGEVLDCISHTYKVTQPCTVDYDEPLYAAPVSIAKQSETDSSSSSMRTTVRTKELTDDEIDAFIDRAWDKQMSMPEIIRAVIAADREKNRAS